MDRYWLLTWTAYGTWLPGDARGFVGRIRENNGPRVEHDSPGTPYDSAMKGLLVASRDRMRGKPIWLTEEQAAVVGEDLQATVAYRGWALVAAAVMANHVHVVVGVPGDPDPAKLLQLFKSYASRRLSERFGKPDSATWWTESGSRRKLPDDSAVNGASEYVMRQERPLWTLDRRAGDESPP